jgi:antitoxin MazE
VEIELVRIGNSRGVRIPKPLIEQCGLGDTVELQVEEDRIVISSRRRPRQGWRDAFVRAGSPASDELLLEPGANQFDREECTW